jgi:hypothetical protein
MAQHPPWLRGRSQLVGINLVRVSQTLINVGEVQLYIYKNKFNFHCSVLSLASRRLIACEDKLVWGDLDPDQYK